MNPDLDSLISEWTRLGVGFDARSASSSRTIEEMVLDSVRIAPASPRLFDLVATWLNRYGEAVARSRLIRVLPSLTDEELATMGFLLDIAQQGTHPPRFASIIAKCRPVRPARPLFEVERRTPELIARCERRASDISRRWGVWCEPFELRHALIHPPEWVLRHNPSLRTRLDLRGDMRAAALAALEHDPGAGESEVALARAAGGSRSQVRAALDNLELTGRVRRIKDTATRRTRIVLCELPGQAPPGS